MDPFVVLSAAAAVTKTLLLGTGICLIAQRDPIPDRQAGHLDRPGLGRPFPCPASATAGTRTRWPTTAPCSRPAHKLARERIEAMKAIWTNSKAEYHGEFVNFDPMMTWPKPVQKPHPPVLVGGAFPYGARRGAKLTAMAGCLTASVADSRTCRPCCRKFREMAAEAGRDLASVPITIWGAKENLDLLKRDRDDGVSRVVVSLDSAKADTILPELDRWANLIRQLGG